VIFVLGTDRTAISPGVVCLDMGNSNLHYLHADRPEHNGQCPFEVVIFVLTYLLTGTVLLYGNQSDWDHTRM